MLPLPYPAPFSAILYVLFSLDLLLLVGGLAFGPLDPARMGRLSRPLCMSLSAILVGAAALQYLAAGYTLAAEYGRLILAGMGLGFLGDLIMARVIPAPNRLIWGMVAFGLGHVVYVFALLWLGIAYSYFGGPVGGMIVAPLWAGVSALAVGLWYAFVRKPGGDRVLNAGALVYSLLMATTNAFAISVAARAPRFIPLAVGAALFLLSDLVLGNYNIRGRPWRRVNDVIWVTYNLGQLLIVSSVAALAGIPLPVRV